jgi:hypothetical protein
MLRKHLKNVGIKTKYTLRRCCLGLETRVVNIYRIARMDQNFDDYPGFQPKTTP